jgi:diamine N-acetyltransferase|tara:strand:- start:640 stop:1374 length:735 start_codon:yes stop_codon:yes gene_type:complete
VNTPRFAHDIVHHIRHHFEDPARIIEVLSDAGISDNRPARAVLYLAGGSISMFEHYVREAKRDIYDVLLWAEYEDKIDGHPVKLRDMNNPLAGSGAEHGIDFQPVSNALRSDVESLGVYEHQQSFIASNRRLLDQASAEPAMVPQAIFGGGVLVGFVMHEIHNPRVASIHRLMIDAPHQSKGYGRRAMLALMQELTDRGIETIYLSFRPENDVARSFFSSLNFVHETDEEDGEVVYRHGPSLPL